MRISSAIAFSSLALLLSGCASAPFATVTQTASVPGTAIQGKVYGGQQPIVGASVSLYAAGTSGYGSPSMPLLSSPGYVTTDSNGNFTITGDYTCPSATSQVYLYAGGGNPGSRTNSAAGLLAGLGSCGSLTPSTFIVLNEVSTIATAYAIAGFATNAFHVGSPSPTTDPLAAAGIANAFAAAANLETLNTGVALATTPPGNGTVPTSEINTLANILAACVNSTGPASSPCSTLFMYASNPLGPTTETASAAINIARNPELTTTAIGGLFMLQSGFTDFQPSLSTAPNDFTIAITYTGGGLAGPAGLAIDRSGNVWVANSSGTSISEFSPIGEALSGSSGYTGNGLYVPVGIAIDSSGNVWAANYFGNSISEFNSSGSSISGSPYIGGGLDSPYGIAIDQSGHVWVANFGVISISEFGSGGSPITGSGGITTGGLNAPEDVAIDVSGNVWVSNNGVNSISEFNSSGTANAGSPFTGGGLNAPGGIAIDGLGNIWAANTGANDITELNSSGTAVSGSSGYTLGGLNTPYDVAVDGTGNVWVTNNGGNSISEFTSSGTPLSGSSGYIGSGLNGSFGLAIDGSGNVWVTNFSTSSPNITEFVGVASPVATPIVANLLPPYGTYAVNKP